MDEYRQLLPYFPGWIQVTLAMVPEGRQQGIREIRLRQGQPLTLVGEEGVRFLASDGLALRSPSPGLTLVRLEDLEDCLKRVCGYSMQSCMDELAQGFCTLPGGHRVGIAGAVSVEKGKILGLRQPSSMNFRIARRIPGASGDLIRQLYQKSEIPSVLIAGPPASGKTTLLRDLISRLSAGEGGRFFQTAVVDERGELGWGGEGALGPCTDLLRGYPKGEGMEIALRTLSPELLACDEIGGERESRALLESQNAGVALLASAHGEDPDAVFQRPGLRCLQENGVFNYLVLLEGRDKPGKIREIRLLKKGAVSARGEECI